MDITKLKNEFLFIPLGGSGEIGMNMNLYHYKGKWLIVDMGAGFADDYLPGVDIIVPDITFIKKYKKDIVGLILTHAHEDHCGAVQYIWNELKCPIYTTPFTANFLKAKLAEMKYVQHVPISEVACGSKLSLDPFDIDLVSLTHSAPEMQCLVINTDQGRVLHTGDWKFDHNPLIGSPNDEILLKQYGDKGVLAMVGDSTNVFNPGTSGSEGDLRESLIDIIGKCKKLVTVTTFASNLARVETVIKAAEESGRKVVISGRSLWRIIRAAQESGYLRTAAPFLDEREIGKYPREKLLVLCTGCQGEPLAAATKIAGNSHPHIRLVPGDTIIFSSKIIPGNDKKIFRLFNQFVKNGVEVLTEKDHFVHVSGHPAREELERMYKLVRPQVAIPVHGELIHMHEHVKLAKEWGVPHAVQVENGDVVRLADGKTERIDKVQSGYIAVDGNYLIPTNSPVLKMRRRIKEDGILIITLILNSANMLRVDPILSAPGLLDREEDRDLLSSISDEVRFMIEESIKPTKKSSKTKSVNDTIVELAKSTARRMIKQEVGKNPPVEVMIERIA